MDRVEFINGFHLHDQLILNDQIDLQVIPQRLLFVVHFDRLLGTVRNPA
jgi:hypothetical protein